MNNLIRVLNHATEKDQVYRLCTLGGQAINDV